MTFPDYGQEDRTKSLGRVTRGFGLSTMMILACYSADGIAPQSDVITFTAPDNSTEYEITITRGGVSELVSFTSDGSATAAESATALAAAIEANDRLTALVTATSALGGVTIEWRKGLTGSVALTTNPSSRMALVTTAAAETKHLYGNIVERATVTEDLPDGLNKTYCQNPSGSGVSFGIVMDDRVTEQDGTEDVTGPRAGTAMSVAFSNGNGNFVLVPTGETTVTAGAAVYVGSAGDENGLVYKASGSGRVLWPGASFESIDSPGAAQIQL